MRRMSIRFLWWLPANNGQLQARRAANAAGACAEMLAPSSPRCPWQTSSGRNDQQARACSSCARRRQAALQRLARQRRRQQRHPRWSPGSPQGRCRRAAGSPGGARCAASSTSTALATTVAAASAIAAVAASTVTLSAMPSEWLRPRQPLVATPRTGSSARTVEVAVGAAAVRRRAAQRRGVEGGEVGDQPDACRFARRQVQRDVAAVVDPGPAHAGAPVGADQLLCHRRRPPPPSA